MIHSQNSYKKSNFGPAFLFLRKRERQALANYYEFCRLMDDIVDEPCASPATKLQEWQQEIVHIYQNKPQTDLGKKLVLDVQNFSIPQDRFTLLIEGMRADLEGKKYASFEDLNWYLHRVAVIVGQATLDILRIKGAQADKLAWELGSAVQLTNIVRDIREDANLGRVYLPTNITPLAILKEEQPDTVHSLLLQTAQRAHAHYQKAFGLMKEFPRLKMLPCRIMGYVYLKNLAKIERGGFVSKVSVKLTKSEKLRAVFYALYKTFF